MNRKKATLLLGAAALLLVVGSGSGYAAYDKDADSPAKQMKSQQVSMEELAKKLGIDTTGMTPEQMKLAISEKGTELKTGGVQVEKKPQTPEQIHENLLQAAKELGVDTTGLTDDQLEAALRAKKIEMSQQNQQVSLEDMAKKNGIDPTGKTPQEIKIAINEKIAGDNPKAEKKPQTPEQIHENHLQAAGELGVDPTGLTDAQLEEALKAKKMELHEKTAGKN